MQHFPYLVHAFNVRRQQLYTVERYADSVGYVTTFAACESYDTAVWATSSANGLASGYVERFPRYANATGAPAQYIRNRIEYFEIWHGSIMLARVERYRDHRGVNQTRVIPMAGSEAQALRGDAPAVSAALAPESAAAPLAPGSGPYDETGNIPSSECETPASDYYAAPDGFEPNPYWGDLGSVNGVYVTHADTGTCGVALYGGDGTGRPDGQLIEFFEAPSGDTYGALQRAGYDESRATIVNHSNSLTVSAEEWDRLADEVNWLASSRKFSNGLAERLHDASLDSGQDETLGESDGFGWFALFASDRAILSTDSQGFVGAVRYGSEQEARGAWSELERDHERFCLTGLEDALPTGECDEVFLIFDTARHAGSVADRDEIREHVHQCRICLPYRYTLDEF